MKKISGSTKGEIQVERLLKNLAKTDDYYYVSEMRITGKLGTLRPDFVVAIWKLGVAVIEVKDYLTILEGSDQHQIIIKRADGTKIKVKNPQKTAHNYAMALKDLFQEDPTLMGYHQGENKLCFPLQEVVIFPNISQKLLDVYGDAEIFTKKILIGKETLRSPKAFAHALKSLPWLFLPSSPLTPAQQTSIRRILNPRLDVGEGGTLTPLQEVLSEETLKVAKSGTVRLVRGVAGSGKSLVLVKRAQYIREMNPELRILAMTFNKQLNEDLRWRISDPEIEVKTFHAICSQIHQQAHKSWRNPSSLIGWLQHSKRDYIEEHDMSAEFVCSEIAWRKDINLQDNDTYLQIERKGRGQALKREKREIINQIFDEYQQHQRVTRAKGQLWEDWNDVPYIAYDVLTETKNHPMLDAYDVILLDEAQDFAPSWIRLVKKLIKPNGILFVCDDPTQSLFRNFSWKAKGIDMRGRSRVLRIPFRSSRQISQAAHALIQDDPRLRESSDIIEPTLDSSDIHEGDLPLLMQCKDKDDEIVFIENEVQHFLDNGVDGKEIAILCHNKRDVRKWAWMRNNLNIIVEHFDKMKGLEYRLVFLPGLHSAFDTQKQNEKDDYFISTRRQAIFTGMTRARQILIMSFYDNFPKELQALEPFVYQAYR